MLFRSRELRDTPERIAQLPVVTDNGLLLTLGDVAYISVSDGPTMIRSENGRLATFVYIDVRGRDIASVVSDLQRSVAAADLPEGVTAAYSGQFEYLARAAQRLVVIGPVTLGVVFLLLFFTFRRLDEALLVMASIPFALIGGVWLVYLLGYNLSVAVGVGFIALAGLAAEFGVVMMLFLIGLEVDAAELWRMRHKILGLGLTQIIGWGTTYYLLGALSQDIASSTGWSGTLIFGAFSAALLLSGLISRHGGRLIDRIGGRRVMIAGSLCATAGLGLMGLFPYPAAYVAGWLLLGLAMRFATYDAAFASLTQIVGQGARRAISSQ